MKVLKFGGTSVGKPERMRSVEQLCPQKEPVFLVLSAITGVTNALVEISALATNGELSQALAKVGDLETLHRNFASQLYAQPHSLEKAQAFLTQEFNKIRATVETKSFGITHERILLAEGEILSTHLFSFYAQEVGREAVLLDALSFMKIDENEEPVLTHIEQQLQPILQKTPHTQLWITQGYICRNAQGEVDNLKRGGSDYTASLVGAALRAQEVQIWTDIDGMHNNDPRIVKNTLPIAELSFDEAAELAYFGAKILHPATILPAQKYNIPVRLLNTMQPEAQGTIIHNAVQNKGVIKSIAAKDGITAIKIRSSRMLLAYGFLRRIFEIFESYKTAIDMITTSEVAVSLTIDQDKHLEAICKELEKLGVVEIDRDLTIVCLVGNQLNQAQGLTAKVLKAVEELPVRMVSIGGSAHNISLLLPSSHKNYALNVLNEGLFTKQAQHSSY